MRPIFATTIQAVSSRTASNEYHLNKFVQYFIKWFVNAAFADSQCFPAKQNTPLCSVIEAVTVHLICINCTVWLTKIFKNCFISHFICVSRLFRMCKKGSSEYLQRFVFVPEPSATAQREVQNLFIYLFAVLWVGNLCKWNYSCAQNFILHFLWVLWFYYSVCGARMQFVMECE